MTMSCIQLHKRAERIGCLLMEKGKLNTGNHVALLYPPGVELIAAFYGCLYVGKRFYVIGDFWVEVMSCNFLVFKILGVSKNTL